MLVVEIEQLLPSTEGWTSANFAFMRQRPPGDRCGYRPMQRAAVWHTNGRYSMDFFPTYLLGHKRPGSRMIFKWRRGTAGPITMRLARAGANPGAADDNGTTLMEASTDGEAVNRPTDG